MYHLYKFTEKKIKIPPRRLPQQLEFILRMKVSTIKKQVHITFQHGLKSSYRDATLTTFNNFLY